MISQWENTLHGCWGRNGILQILNQASRRKKYTIKAFWWFKGDLISQRKPKFYLCDESNPINPQCGKICANFYISPPHPPHPQFDPHKWWKFRYTSWLTKTMHLNRPARCAGQQDATLASSGVKIPVNVKMSASMGSSIIESRSWYEDSGSNEPEQWYWLPSIRCLLQLVSVTGGSFH